MKIRERGTIKASPQHGGRRKPTKGSSQNTDGTKQIQKAKTVIKNA